MSVGPAETEKFAPVELLPRDAGEEPFTVYFAV
jgi:hypothetical protein